MCEVKGGGTPSTKVKEYWENGEILWFSPTDLSKNNSLVLTSSEKKITEEGLQKSSAKLLPANTIMMSSRATIGLFGLIDQPFSTNQGFINVIPNKEELRYYLLFNLIGRKQEIINKANGSTFKEISKKNFKELEFIEPSEKDLKRFQKQTEPIIAQIRNLELLGNGR